MRRDVEQQSPPSYWVKVRFRVWGRDRVRVRVRIRVSVRECECEAGCRAAITSIVLG